MHDYAKISSRLSIRKMLHINWWKVWIFRSNGVEALHTFSVLRIFWPHTIHLSCRLGKCYLLLIKLASVLLYTSVEWQLRTVIRLRIPPLIQVLCKRLTLLTMTILAGGERIKRRAPTIVHQLINPFRAWRECCSPGSAASVPEIRNKFTAQ